MMARPPAPTIIRASSLSGYPDCPRRGAARLFWREIEAAGFRLRRTPRGIAGAVGTALHAGAAQAYREKGQHGSLPPLSVVSDVALDSLHDQIDRGEIAYDGPNGATHTAREAELQTLGMTASYQRTIAPTVDPIQIEERLEAEVEPGLVLSGQPDIVAREPHRVRDLKSGARRPGSAAPQLGAYALLARSHGLDIVEASIDFIQRVAVKKPQPDPVTNPVAVAPAETAATNILRHIAGDLATFRNGDPERRILPGDPWAFLANPSSMLCSAKYCPAYGTEFCHEGQQGKE